MSAAAPRFGEMHKDAKLSRHEVELIRRLHEDSGWGYRRLAKKFEIGRSTVRAICRYKTWPAVTGATS